MATRRPARLYQKSTGVFFIRVLLPASKKGTKKPELRRSLRTRSLVEARSISSYVNALLERTPNEERANVINNLLPHAVSTWTLPGGISAEDDDDQRRLLDFMAQRPEIAKAIVEQMQARTRYLNSLADRTGALATGNPPSASPQQILLPSPLAASPAPSATMRLSSALKAYRYRYAERFEKHKSRTADDKESLFDMLRSYLEARYPELGADPLLHQIDSRHLDGFLHEQEKRPGKHKDLEGNSRGLAPRTMLKKASDLSHFFEFAKTSEKVILANPMLDLADALEAWQMQASQEDNAYAPFTSSHLQSIFEPRHYLSVTRDADHFWCPLLGAHLGCRLGEVVDRKMSDIGYIQEVDLWYINVAEGKNSNSIRALPITQPLIELGFVKYVQKMRALGAKYLFPHRDWTTPTAISKPSKTTSERFAESLDRIGITSPRLVFHSFRHTVITMMHDAGVPLAIAMQIVGHEAQEHALEMGSITEEEARSVHLSTYVHMGEARPGIEHPLLPLKTALERAIKLPLAYEKLAICAQIVLEHMKKPGTEFVSGWKQQRQRYTDTLLSRLA